MDVVWQVLLYRQSTLKYCALPGGNLGSNESKKQTVVTNSNPNKVEYVAMLLMTCERLVHKQLMTKLSDAPTESMKLYCL